MVGGESDKEPKQEAKQKEYVQAVLMNLLPHKVTDKKGRACHLGGLACTCHAGDLAVHRGARAARAVHLSARAGCGHAP